MDSEGILTAFIFGGFCWLIPYIVTMGILKAIKDSGGIKVKFNHSDMTVVLKDDKPSDKKVTE